MDNPGQLDTGSARRRSLVLAAYERIAAEGFEGLRTRDVAADVGVNVATLHYYFPTKEALIRAVVGYAMSRFVATIPTEGSGSAVLRGHLQGLARLIKEDRQLWAVLGELTLRAPRDPDLGQILGKTDQTWQAKLAEMLRSAAAGAGLTPGLNADDAAAVIVATIKGLALPTLSGSDPGRVDRVFGQLLNWVGLQDQITQ